MSPRFKQFLLGIKAELPIAVGVIPFGMIYGVLALGAGLPPTTAQAMSTVVFAGSAQFITVQQFQAGALGWVIVFTAGIVNLRHLLYSASLAPYLKHLHPLWKWGLSYLLTDEAYAVSVLHYQEKGELQHKHWFFLGSGLTLWTTWQASTAAGIYLGAVIPESWSLDFTLALTFIGLVTPSLKDRPSLAAAFSAGTAAVLLYDLPFRLGLIIAALIGITLAMRLEERQWKPG